MKQKPIKKLEGQILVRIVVTPSETSDDKTKPKRSQSSEKSKSSETRKSKEKKEKQKDGKSQVSGDVRGLTDIHHAAHEGDFEKVKELLQQDREEALLNSKTGKSYYLRKKSFSKNFKILSSFTSKNPIASKDSFQFNYLIFHFRNYHLFF
jgi:hypothetical protein